MVGALRNALDVGANDFGVDIPQGEIVGAVEVSQAEVTGDDVGDGFGLGLNRAVAFAWLALMQKLMG